MKSEKSRRKYMFSWGGYQYAPESVRFTSHGKPLYVPEGTMVRQNACCGRNDEVIAELKKIIRKQQATPDVVYTVGLISEDGKTYIYTNHLYTKDRFNTKELLSIFKMLKEQVEDEYIETSVTVESGEFVPGQKTTAKKTVHKVKVSKKPILIRLKFE